MEISTPCALVADEKLTKLALTVLELDRLGIRGDVPNDDSDNGSRTGLDLGLAFGVGLQRTKVSLGRVNARKP